MTGNAFFAMVERRIEQIRSVLISKSKEYSTDKDKLHNFKSNPIGCKETPTEVCWGYLRKHLQSIYDIAMGNVEATQAQIEEKIGDSINYMFLMEALLIEREYDRQNSAQDIPPILPL